MVKILRLFFEIGVFICFQYGIWGTKVLSYHGPDLMLRLFLTAVSLHCLIEELKILQKS